MCDPLPQPGMSLIKLFLVGKISRFLEFLDLLDSSAPEKTRQKYSLIGKVNPPETEVFSARKSKPSYKTEVFFARTSLINDIL